jgi:hypothetical protein
VVHIQDQERWLGSNSMRDGIQTGREWVYFGEIEMVSECRGRRNTPEMEYAIPISVLDHDAPPSG